MNFLPALFDSEFDLASPQVCENLTIVPVLLHQSEAADYVTMKESLDVDGLVVTEISEAGSVSEVRVVNRLGTPLLILEGEELLGAKQNRVLNTTVLISAFSEAVVPVSCTEQGRWAWNSDRFAESGTVMPASIRARKNRSVNRSRRQSRGWSSDQAEVWLAIDDLLSMAEVSSSSQAMRDVYVNNQAEVSDLLGSFRPLTDQVGLLAFIGGDFAGMDILGSDVAYGHLSSKLTQSYVLEALLNPDSGKVDEPIEAARGIIAELRSCTEEIFPGVDLGREYRYDSSTLVGAVLIHEDRLVHGAFHAVTPALPFERSYWVRPGKVLAGYYPGDLSKASAEKKLNALLDVGIRCVINLVEEEELRPYGRLLRNLAAKRDIDLLYVRIPVRDLDVPNPTTMATILDMVESALNRGERVYVHCWGGVGRTGTVVGCYLARNGQYVGNDALKRIATLRRLEPTAYKQSPETEDQRAMVMNWKPGQ